MITTIYARPSFYGGRQFLIYNDKTKRYHQGNTASTAVSYHNANVQINGVTQKELKEVKRQLNNNDYTEYNVSWAKEFDTYGDISKQLLVRD